MKPADARRWIHVSTALALFIPLRAGWDAFRTVLILLTVMGTVAEVVRLRNTGIGAAVTGAIPVFRPGERHRPSGAWWLLLAYTALSWLPPAAAVSGVLVAALADPAASWAGSRWGVPRGPRGKSWLGTGAAAGTAFLVLGPLGLSPLAWVAATLGSAAAERWSGPVNDNLTVGPVAGVMVWWFGGA